MRIRTKVLAVIVGLFLIGLISVLRLGEQELLPRYKEAVEDTLVDSSLYLSTLIQNSSIENNRLNPQKVQSLFNSVSRNSSQIYQKIKDQVEMHLYVTDEKGIVIYDSMDANNIGKDFSNWNDVYKTLRHQYGARSTRLVKNDPLSATLYVASPIKANQQIVGVVSIGKPVKNFHAFITSAQKRLYTYTLLLFVVAVVIGFYLSYKIISPLEKLRMYLLSLATTHPLPPPPARADEIGDLTHTFLKMKEQLEDKEYVEKFVHHFAHEIKSPLSTILGASEILEKDEPALERRRLLKNINHEAFRLKEIIDNLLEVASLEKRSQPLKTESFDLQLLIEEIIESYFTDIKHKDLNINIQVPENHLLEGNRFLVWRALANLIKNAIDFSPKHSKIQIKFTEPKQLLITDEGAGLPPHVQQRLFEKFFSTERPDTKQKGTGLGLVFTKEVCEQHGWSLELKNLEKGCEVRIGF
jgi:two-component system, OmpR family, sensor histidine kinase CreC